MPEEFLFSDLLKQVESTTGFSALPANEYDVEIISAQAGKTGTQKSKVSLRYKVLSGPHQGRSIFNDHVISPSNSNAMVIFFRHMAAYGLGHDYFSSNPSLERVANDLNGKKVRLRLGIRTWDGAERNSVLAIMPLGAGNGPGPMMPPIPAPASQAQAPPMPAPSGSYQLAGTTAPPASPAPAPPMPAAPLPPPVAAAPPEPDPEPDSQELPTEEPKLPKPPPGLPF